VLPVGPREDFDRYGHSAPFVIFEEEGIRRDICAGA
jgi:hypothetical protein